MTENEQWNAMNTDQKLNALRNGFQMLSEKIDKITVQIETLEEHQNNQKDTKDQ